MSKKKTAIIVCLVLIGIVSLAYLAYTAVDSINSILDSKVYIYADMSDLSVFENSIVGDLSDDRIGDVSFADSFLHEISYDSLTFKLYAYRFETADGADEYYKAITGRTPVKSSHWNRQGGFGLSGDDFGLINELAVKNDEFVYRVRYVGSGGKFSRILEYINSVFSVQIR